MQFICSFSASDKKPFYQKAEEASGLMGMAEHFGPWFCGLGKLTGNCARQAAAMKWKRRRRLSFVRSFVLLRPWIIGETHSERLFITPWRRRRWPPGYRCRWEDRNERTNDGRCTRTHARSLSGSLARRILRRHALCESWITLLRCRRSRPPLLRLHLCCDFSSRRRDAETPAYSH